MLITLIWSLCTVYMNLIMLLGLLKYCVKNFQKGSSDNGDNSYWKD